MKQDRPTAFKRLLNYKHYIAFADFLVLSVSFLLVDSIISPVPFGYDIFILLGLSLLFLIIFLNNNMYKLNVILKKTLHRKALIRSFLYGVLLIIPGALLFSYFREFSWQLFTIYFAITSLSLVYLLRIGVVRKLLLTIKSHAPARNVLLIGNGSRGDAFYKALNENNSNWNLIGHIKPVDVQKCREEIISYKKLNQIHEILITSDDLDHISILELTDKCASSTNQIKIAASSFAILTAKVKNEHYFGIPVINFSMRTKGIYDKIFKRIFDVIGALLGMFLLAPLYLIISILIKISSPGGIIYTQKRIGHNGREFDFYKFRSMVKTTAEDDERKAKMIEFMKMGNQSAADTKVVNESRITWIGRIIRKTSLDELPQLYNVIKGDMSLVGPRPCLPYEYENYESWHKKRLEVIPGCTGLWQVSGRSTVSFDDSVLLDLFYIRNKSFLLDLRIILKTIPVMLFSKGGK